MMRTRDMLLAVGALIAVAIPAAAQTQITTAVIEGVVVDASGAVLPGVEVEVRNADTNLTRTLTTDREGRFVALQLPPGRYTVTLHAVRLRHRSCRRTCVVTVGESVRLNPTMKLSRRCRNGDRDDAGADVDTSRDRRGQHPRTRPRSTPRRSSAASSRIC